MADPRINLEITGRDRGVQAMLDRARQQLKGFGQTTEKTRKQLESMGRRNGLDQLGKGLEGATRGSFNLFKTISRIVDPLSIITGAGTLAGLAALEAKFASFGQANVNSARSLNMSVDHLTRWQFAAKRAGVSAEEMTSNIGGLEKAVAAMRVENSPANGIANQLLGAGWQQKYKSDTDLLVAISGRISNLHGNAKALAMEQVGSAFGLDQNVVGMLARGPQWLQHSLQLAQQHGAMTGGQANALDQLKQSLTDVGESIEGVANGVTSAFAPALAKSATELSQWIDKHRGEIVHDVQGFVKDIGDELKKVPWDDILKAGKGFFDAFGQFANTKIAAGGALALLLGSKIGLIAAPFQALSAAIGALSGSGAGSFAALGRALRLAGFAMIGGEIVKAGVDAAGGSSDVGNIAGDAVTGALIGGRLGPLGAAVGAAAGAAIAGITAAAPSLKSAALPADIQAEVTAAARRRGVPVDFAVAQFQAEGGGYDRISSVGAFGPAQLMPATAAGLGVATGIHDPAYDWRKNVDAGVRYEQQLLAHYHGNRYLAAAAYNWGPGAVDTWIADGMGPRDLPAETRRYIATIHANGGMDDIDQTSAAPPDTDARGHRIVAPTASPAADPHVIELHVSAPAGSTVTARQTGGSSTVKTVTAMPSSVN
ncbi:lytic transglycosylase domain-containing protein [Acidisoma sp. 7E03]